MSNGHIPHATQDVAWPARHSGSTQDSVFDPCQMMADWPTASRSHCAIVNGGGQITAAVLQSRAILISGKIKALGTQIACTTTKAKQGIASVAPP
jgi:hypothetical protein